MKLYPHQQEVLKQTENLNKAAFYMDMGLQLGKTFVGSEKMAQLDARVNLVICQKSKVNDWVEHFKKYYSMGVFDLTDKNGLIAFLTNAGYPNGIEPTCTVVGSINYELAFRRPEL